MRQIKLQMPNAKIDTRHAELSRPDFAITITLGRKITPDLPNGAGGWGRYRQVYIARVGVPSNTNT